MSAAETSATKSLSNDHDAVVTVEASKSTSLTKRAKTTRACDECRKRKVKCDGAQPCQRCSKNDIQCVFAKLPPKRGPPKQYVEVLETRLRLIEKALMEIDGSKQFMGQDVKSEPNEADWLFPQVPEESEQQEIGWDAESWMVTNPGLYVDDRHCRTDRIPSMYETPSSVFSEKSSSGTDGSSSESTVSDTPLTIYHLEPELQLPSKLIGPNIIADNMPDLIETYFKHVHKYVPMIHKPQFLKQMASTTNPPSLILLNAMCAVAAKWHKEVDGAAGPAGITFYQRAFALIDDHFDAPRVSTIQAIILLVKYQEQHRRSGYFFRPYMFMGMVARMCDDIGLSRNQGRCIGDSSDIEMRKRTFWVAYIYDLLMSIEQGRKPHFTANECDQEFPIATSEEGPALEEIINNQNVLIQLSKVMGEIYRLARLTAVRKGKRRSMLEVVEEQGKLFVLHTHLENFLHELPANLAYAPTADVHTYPAEKHQIGDPFVGFLHMQYHLSIILLHRPYMISPLPDIGTEFSPYLHQDLCATSASHITNIAQVLLDKDDLEAFHYPSRGVQHTIHCLIAAATVHQNKIIQSFNVTDVEVAKLQYLNTMNILKALAPLSPSQSFIAAIKDAELAHMYGRMAVNPMDLQASAPSSHASTPLPEHHHLFSEQPRLNRSQSDISTPDPNQIPSPSSPMHPHISNLALRAAKLNVNQPGTSSSQFLRHSSAVMTDPLRYAALMQQGEPIHNMSPPNYIDRQQQFVRPLGHTINISQDDMVMPMMSPAPIPNRSQSTNRLIPNRSRSWIQKATSAGLNVIPYKPKRDGIGKPSNVSPSTSVNARNKASPPQRGMSPTPSRTTSTPRVAPYSRPMQLGHHRRHTISALTADQEAELPRNTSGRPHTWTSPPGPTVDPNLMMHMGSTTQLHPEDMGESMLVDGGSNEETDDSMVQFLMNETVQWDMIPQ
ncbi:hypothetical protein NQZ79_g3089 [Umbelopsis isabellina]|nr:hypothetical protein NQZ79_g3089 [Umbelopsis isabellina]